MNHCDHSEKFILRAIIMALLLTNMSSCFPACRDHAMNFSDEAKKFASIAMDHGDAAKKSARHFISMACFMAAMP